jgi:hypothetical protein
MLVGAVFLYLNQAFVFAQFVPATWRSEQTTMLLVLAQTMFLVAVGVGFCI